MKGSYEIMNSVTPDLQMIRGMTTDASYEKDMIA